MRIRKTFQGHLPDNKILNNPSNSATDTYSCKQINEMLIFEEEDPTVPEHVKNISEQDIKRWDEGTGGSGVSIDQIYPVGGTYITPTNINPNDLGLPGTWELIDKQFKNVYEYKSGTAIATLTSLSSLGVRMTRTGHLVHLDCNATIKANLTDSTVNVCTLKPTVLGFTGELIDRAMYFCGFSDGGNNMIQFAMNAKTFILESLDVVGDDSHKVSSGAAIYWSQTIIADNFTQLADSYCDKFYWKRTA